MSRRVSSPKGVQPSVWVTQKAAPRLVETTVTWMLTCINIRCIIIFGCWGGRGIDRLEVFVAANICSQWPANRRNYIVNCWSVFLFCFLIFLWSDVHSQIILRVIMLEVWFVVIAANLANLRFSFSLGAERIITKHSPNKEKTSQWSLLHE